MPIGSGMSALAKLLIDKGHIVYGVDEKTFYYTEKGLNCKIETFENVKLTSFYFYIIGNAFKKHKITIDIITNKWTYMFYPEFISSYFKNYTLIAVAGSHGKTTSTKMISSFIETSYIIGDGSGSGKSNKNMTIEACEYRNTFLNYFPDYSLILNCDYDHPDFFTKESYIQSFKDFINQSNIVILNGDDQILREIKDDKIITFGKNSYNDIVFNYDEFERYSIISIDNKKFKTNLIGLHYAYDFVGAYLIAKLFNVTDSIITKKINNFLLPKRRLETRKKLNKIFIHDYAHHPTEIYSVYQSIKSMYPKHKFVVFFEPHTLSRSLVFQNEFKRVLNFFEKVYILPIFYSVRERTDLNEEKLFYDNMGYCVKNNNEITSFITNDKDFNGYIFLGAGDVNEIFNYIINN